ncbi:MAG: DUF1697 domain-containing protein [archaeon]|jgi:uncharacterized protein (DUF1697 family)
MKYVALLRGINVGGNHKVDMKKLKTIFESIGCSNVFTYINSGNVLFESNKNSSEIKKEVEAELKKNLGFDVPTLIKTRKELQNIAHKIPLTWVNDDAQKTDVAYLFSEIDSKKILDVLPINKEYVQIQYIKGALFWNVKRENYNKSKLNKIISCDEYKFMTVRNVNTARKLAEQIA